MLRTVIFGLVLFGIWVLLSGHFDPLLLGLGAASSALVVYIAHRMEVIDHEAVPIHVSWRIIFYWPWLGKEIVVANLDVAKAILSPKMPISPAMIDVTPTQKTELGKVIYANSITLTPGTVTVAFEGESMLVHGLTRAGIEGVLSGEMDRRVTAIEGVHPGAINGSEPIGGGDI